MWGLADGHRRPRAQRGRRSRRLATGLSIGAVAALIAGCAHNTSPPTITGTTVDGSTLTANPGTWTYNGSISYAYQWERCDQTGNACQTLSGLTAPTYLLGPADVGSTLRVLVTATDSDGAQYASTATSAPTPVVAARSPSNTTLPTIAGTTQAGDTLTASPGSWTGTPPLAYGYQWQRCGVSGGSCADVGNATSQTYGLSSADVGFTIRVLVTASNAAGAVPASSGASALVAAAHDPVVVAVGDIACAPGDTSNACEQGLTAQLAGAQNPDALLTLGDNQYESGLLSEFDGAGAYNATWGVFNGIVYPDVGNHEYAASPTAAGYFSYFGSRAGASTGDYSFNLGTWHVIALDSSCSDSGCGDLVAGQTTSAQVSWLQNDLAAHPAACTLAYWHHPRFSVSWTGDSPGVGPLFSALYNAHADLVLSGHDHVYERYGLVNPSEQADPAGVREIVAGTGGESLFDITSSDPNVQFSDARDFGVLVLTLHATSYSWAFKRLDGTVADSGTTSCHGALSGAGALAGAAGTRLRRASIAARRARIARPWPPGPSGRALRFGVSLPAQSKRQVSRHGLAVTVHLDRAANVAITLFVRRGHRLTAAARARETETQLPGPRTRLYLRVPARCLQRPGDVVLVLRLTAQDAALHRARLTVRVPLR